MSGRNRSRFEEADLSRLMTFPMSELERKVERGAFAKPVRENASLRDYLDSLPDILAAGELKTFAAHIAAGARAGKAAAAMFGGHVIKTGLAPLLIDWIEKGIITSLSTHGAGIIHDAEIALFGRTSEDVAAGLKDGSFGMSRDTADFINRVIADPDNVELGFGEALGRALVEANAPCADLSLLCACHKAGVPLTVHVGIGTDIIHQHPSADGAAIGRASLKDFRILARAVGALDAGGSVINFGSAVIMPEVFLKALTVARNLGYPAHGFWAANFDMFTQYRPTQNVLNRPTMTGGRMFNFIGHHELQIPLLCAMVAELLG